MSTDLILPHSPMEFGISADLFLCVIVDDLIHCSIRPDKPIQQFVTLLFPLDMISFYKEIFIAKHLAVFVTVY